MTIDYHGDTCGVEKWIDAPPFDTVVHVCGERAVGDHKHVCRGEDCEYEWEDDNGTD